MNAIGFATSVQPSAPATVSAAVEETGGQENTDTKGDIFRVVEETAGTAASDNRNPDAAKQQQDTAIIRELAHRDREVRAHEQAHAAVGGQYAGAISYTYQRGPDGVNYAIGGEVSISLPSSGEPQAILQAAEQIKRAALAPANPSSQDRQVAAQASQAAIQARAEIAVEKAAEQAAITEQEATSGATDPSIVNSVEAENTGFNQSTNEQRTSIAQNVGRFTPQNNIGSIIDQTA